MVVSEPTTFPQKKECEHAGCSTKAVFNFEGEKGGRFCAQHKLEGMVNMVVPKKPANPGKKAVAEEEAKTQSAKKKRVCVFLPSHLMVTIIRL